MDWTPGDNKGANAPSSYLLNVQPENFNVSVPRHPDDLDVVTGLATATTHAVSILPRSSTGQDEGDRARRWATGTPLNNATAPAGVRTVPVNGGLTVTWSANQATSEPRTNYSLKVRETGQTVPAGSATRAQLTGLTNGREYTIDVIADNGAGTATTTTKGVPGAKPAPVTGVTVTAQAGGDLISWTNPGGAVGAAGLPHRQGHRPAESTFATNWLRPRKADGTSDPVAISVMDIGYTANVVSDPVVVGARGRPAHEPGRRQAVAVHVRVSWTPPSPAPAGGYTVTASTSAGEKITNVPAAAGSIDIDYPNLPGQTVTLSTRGPARHRLVVRHPRPGPDRGVGHPGAVPVGATARRHRPSGCVGNPRPTTAARSPSMKSPRRSWPSRSTPSPTPSTCRPARR